MYQENPHMQTPWTFVQDTGDRFPRTQGIGQMQQAEGMIGQLEQEKNEADLRKNIANYESKSIGNMKNKLMEMLKGGSTF